MESSLARAAKLRGRKAGNFQGRINFKAVWSEAT
jgi:hypothetical protein